jgi:hypothetical protein
MVNKKSKDVIVWQVDSYPISLELYDSMIIIQDENGNKIKVSKKEPLKLILKLIGNFKTD